MLNYEQIQRLTQGKEIQKPLSLEPFYGGAFDSRLVNDEEIFFAWKGEQADGHDYLKKLENTTIRLILAERVPQKLPRGIGFLQVDNSQATLGMIAAEVVRQSRVQVVALTGSAGKTTAKTWLKQVLQQKYCVCTHPGNFNNHVGCPITALKLRPEHNLLLLEMGTSNVGEIEYLTSLFPPDLAILLNVGLAHIVKFGDLKRTRRAKLEIFSHLKPESLAFLPLKDPTLRLPSPQKQILFGGSLKEITNENKNLPGIQREEQRKFVWSSESTEFTFSVALSGTHVAETLDLVIAVARALEMSSLEILAGLTHLKDIPGRLNLIPGKNGSQLLDGIYNASPESLINMLNTLETIPAALRLAVIGNLAEQDKGLLKARDFLSDTWPEKIDQYVLFGETGGDLKTIIQEKCPQQSVVLCNDIDEALEKVRKHAQPGVLIGLKGSRSSKMESMRDALSEMTKKNQSVNGLF